MGFTLVCADTFADCNLALSLLAALVCCLLVARSPGILPFWAHCCLPLGRRTLQLHENSCFQFYWRDGLRSLIVRVQLSLSVAACKKTHEPFECLKLSGPIETRKFANGLVIAENSLLMIS